MTSYGSERMAYEAPKILQIFRGPSAFMRGQYSTNFADLFSNDIDVHNAYKDGLVALSSFIGGFIIIWGLVIVFLMIKGKAVGCASGRAFELSAVDDNLQKGPTASSHSMEEDDHSEKDEREEAAMETTSFSSSLCSSDAASRFESVTSYDNGTIDASPRLEGRRAYRTRTVFFVFACTVLACVPLALAFSFSPMKATVKSFDGFDGTFQEVDDLIGQVRAALSTISTASQSATGILSQTSTNSSLFCPNINNTNFDQRLARSLLQLSRVISVDYTALQESITNNMTDIEDILETFEDAASIMETSFDRAESVMWMVPGLLLAVSIATAFATFGVILAWKHESGIRLQRCLSYGLLPALTALCLVCWVLGIATVVTTTLSADFCLSGAQSGNPDTTIQNMLLTHGDLPNSTKHHFIAAYTSGCQVSEPALLIVSLERESQDKVDEIWAHISSVDLFGRTALSQDCGGAGLDELLSAARNIAKLLTQVRRALDSASDSLVCERIDSLYTDTVHDSICTDFAEASAWGATTFCFLGISMMILITLRASWRVRIDEDRIYHDESEVAENMIVDEHEEYLRYISKYRHEWQEYDGFGTTSMRQSASFSEEEDGDHDFDDMESGSASETSAANSRPRRRRMADEDETSIESGEISFPSLDVPPTDDSSADQSQVVPMPPPILTDRPRKTQCKAEQNQEVMLCPKSLSRRRNPLDEHGEDNVEEEKAEVDSRPAPARNDNDERSVNTEESTDFSSIGRNAGKGASVNTAGLYWKSQLGLGIEVPQADSLALSPTTSDGGLTSFDLTKTPSPKKAPAFESLKDKVPAQQGYGIAHSLYGRKSSDECDTDENVLQKEPRASYSLKSVRSDQLPSLGISTKKSTESSSSQAKKRIQESTKPKSSDTPKSLTIQTENLAAASPPPTKSPSVASMISDAVLFRRTLSDAAVNSPLGRQIDSLLGSISGSFSFRDERPRTTTTSMGQEHRDERSKTTSVGQEREVPRHPQSQTKESEKPKTLTQDIKDRRKLRHLLQKFDPKSLPATAEDLQTI